ncbi:MAG: adenosylcobinamide-GDP ribazoletransferase [Deltaproteobacteria bacterium]|nr:adenosylcobinamide-GDP ribazoletransferase [Deltaproteobacteria bacterium]
MRCTFPLALTFLTVLPWRRLGEVGPGDLARSMFWFPWVGVILGLGFWGALVGFQSIFPPAAAAALLLSLTVLATRGLHLDGLADTVDGLGGGKNPQERLAIMKDSRLGAFGAVSLFLALLLKFAFFLAWTEKSLGPGLILYPVLSRWGMIFLAYLSPYARPEGGLGRAMTTGVTGRVLLGATLSAVGLSLLVSRISGLLLLAAAGLVVWLLSIYFQKRLGGITGDVLGAANEVLEILVLMGLLLCSHLFPTVSYLQFF